MEQTPSWYIEGLTAAKGDAFQGVHNEFFFLIFDEAVGVQRQFYEAAEGMMTGEAAYQLLICNPTDPSSPVREMELSGDYHVIPVSALDHENIEAELRGDKPLYPGAVSLSWIKKALKNWCTRIDQSQVTTSDIEFPPHSGNWFRPGALFESRALGRWPTSSTNNVWSDAHYQSCLDPQEIDLSQPLEVGCDVARYGDDFTVIVIRRGNVVLEMFSYNGKGLIETAGYIVSMISRHVLPHEAIQGVPIKIDDDGVGGGVVDILTAQAFRVIPVNAGSKAFEAEHFRNRRSELWVSVADRAADFGVDLSRVDTENLSMLKADLLIARFKLNGRGQKEVEPKDVIKTPQRLGRSPDWADALNLCFAPSTEPGEIDWENFV